MQVRYTGQETGSTAPPDALVDEHGEVDMSNAVAHWPDHEHEDGTRHEAAVVEVAPGHWLTDHPDWKVV